MISPRLKWHLPIRFDVLHNAGMWFVVDYARPTCPKRDGAG